MGGSQTREKIIAAADELFYQHGYEFTSFADIAAAVNISRGNFYHHFKTKDDILEAVIKRRKDYTCHMLADWENIGKSPAERIRSFFHILIDNEARIMEHGCPVGTLYSELAKLEHGTRSEAREIFTLFRTWLREQFEQLGYDARSDELAMHVLARSQGVAMLASAYHDRSFIAREVEMMGEWLSEQVKQKKRKR